MPPLEKTSRARSPLSSDALSEQLPTGKKRVVLAGNRQVEFAVADPLFKRLRLLIDSTQLPTYQRQLFDELFPNSLESRDFDPSTVQEMEQTKLSDDERNLRNTLRRSFGFSAPIERTNPADSKTRAPLHIKFTDDSTTLTHRLNRTPWFTRLTNVSLTESRVAMLSEEALGDRIIVSRADHSQQFASSALHTLLRYAIKSPQLFIRAVENDLAFYTDLANGPKTNGTRHHFSFEKVSEETHILVKEALITFGTKQTPSEDLEKALHYAVEYGKLLVIYAYLHDKDTPALGDRYMKARARFNGQAMEPFNEDDELLRSIEQLTEQGWTQLPQIISAFGINRNLLATFVKCLASNRGWGLAASIMKDKRKWKDPFRLKYPYMSTDEALDHDQVSGTVTNMQVLVDEYFPGGFHYHEEGDPPPIGSFDERLRIFAFMLASGMTKDEVEYNCRQLGIPPEQLYFAANEITIGPNTELQNIRFYHDGTEYEQILPVALKIGDVNKAFKMQAVLYGLYYRGPTRAAVELLIQDAITCGMYGDDNQTPQSKLEQRMFLNRTDGEVITDLSDVAPLIPYILYELHDQTRVVSEEELLQNYCIPGSNNLENCLLAEISMDGTIPFKTGTLVEYEGVGSDKDEKYIAAFGEVAATKIVDRDTAQARRIPNEHSFLNRTRRACEKIKSQRFFAIIPITNTQVSEIRNKVVGTPTEAAMRRVLNIWTEQITVGERTYNNPLQQIFAA